MSRRHHRTRSGLIILVITALWTVGLLGLDGGRGTSFQILALVAIGWLASVVFGVHHRRSVETRERAFLRSGVVSATRRPN